jgi:hypothetical protein
VAIASVPLWSTDQLHWQLRRQRVGEWHGRSAAWQFGAAGAPVAPLSQQPVRSVQTAIRPRLLGAPFALS